MTRRARCLLSASLGRGATPAVGGAKVGGMSMSLTMLAAEGEEHLRELPMPAYMYAVIALIAFALLLAVTWAFRGTAAKLGQPKGQHGITWMFRNTASRAPRKRAGGAAAGGHH